MCKLCKLQENLSWVSCGRIEFGAIEIGGGVTKGPIFLSILTFQILLSVAQLLAAMQFVACRHCR